MNFKERTNQKIKDKFWQSISYTISQKIRRPYGILYFSGLFLPVVNCLTLDYYYSRQNSKLNFIIDIIYKESSFKSHLLRFTE